MTDTPFLQRQLDIVDAQLPKSGNPVCVLIYDTQSVGLLIEHICGKPGKYEGCSGGIAWFRVSNYLPTGEKLVQRIMEAAGEVDWIFIHVGGSLLPEPVLNLLKYISGRQDELPRVVVVGEGGDVMSGDKRLRELFTSIGSLVDLRAPGA